MTRHKSSGNSAAPRGVRVAELVHQELAEMIRAGLKDPRIGMVTLTGVDLTADYAYGTVHYTVLPSDPATVATTQAGLERAAGFLRGQLGKRVRIHTIPQLRFVRDQSVEAGLAMSQLIDAALSRQALD